MKKIVIVIGPPGSGKGTQAKRIAKKYGYRHISPGELLRGLEKSSSPTKEEIKALQAMRVGQLVPDDIIYALVFKEVEEHLRHGRGVILDGAIRSAKQAKDFDAFFKKKGFTSEELILDITLSDDETRKRLSNRLMCSHCGEIITASSSAAVCAKCGGQLVKRVDDDDTTIQERIISQGNEALQPIRSWYEQQSKLRSVNGEQSIEAVENDIRAILEKV